MTEEKHYQTGQVLKIIGVTQSSLARWMNQGAITPTIKAEGGAGSKHLWTYSDLVEASVFARLIRQCGFSLKAATSVIDICNSAITDAGISWEGFSRLTVVFADDGSVYALINKTAPEGAEVALSIDLRAIKNKIDEKIETEKKNEK